MKRENVLSWDDYFMGLAHLSAKRSKDPSTQVGAVIVSKDHRVIGIGYNGFPNGCDDDDFPWNREGEVIQTKYPYVVHAELNAILNSNANCWEGFYMFPYFHAMNVRRQLFKPESKKSSMNATNMLKVIVLSQAR